jgi:hypothetical protein
MLFCHFNPLFYWCLFRHVFALCCSLLALYFLYFIIGDASHWYNYNISYCWRLYYTYHYQTMCPRHRTNRGTMWIYQQNKRHVWWLYAKRIQFYYITKWFCQIMEVYIKLYWSLFALGIIWLDMQWTFKFELKLENFKI